MPRQILSAKREGSPANSNGVLRSAQDALLWIAAFSFALGLFLSLTLLLRDLPPTPPVAIGRVTIERASKLRDYTAALLFFVIIAPATIFLYRLGTKQLERDGRC